MYECAEGGVEVRDGLAKTMLDLEECCRGGRRGSEIRICLLDWGESGQMELKFGRAREMVKYLLNRKYLSFFTFPSQRTLLFPFSTATLSTSIF